MLRPAHFGGNPQTAESNKFQRDDTSGEASQTRALVEFERLRCSLEDAGIEAYVFDDTADPHTPDAVFPNNWVSFHADGTVVLYPMQAENRRLERRRDIIDALVTEHGFEVSRIVDLSHYEKRDQFLEGTGSVVLDRPNRIAYACRSARTHREPLAEFGRELGYTTVAFDAVDPDGAPIYHTNVLMWVGRQLAAVCADAIRSPDQRDEVLKHLQVNGREVLFLSEEQLLEFAGNMLEVEGDDGRLLVMSERARRSLGTSQVATIERHHRILSVSLDHIEDVGGGGARCMLAAIELPRLTPGMTCR